MVSDKPPLCANSAVCPACFGKVPPGTIVIFPARTVGSETIGPHHADTLRGYLCYFSFKAKTFFPGLTESRAQDDSRPDALLDAITQDVGDEARRDRDAR